MHYVASYLLAALGGNTSPSAKDIKKILDSVGIEADDDQLNKVISELNGKNIEDVIAQGIRKLASVPSGRPVAVSAAPVAAEEKKEESEESDDDMGFGSFDESPAPLQIKPFLRKTKQNKKEKKKNRKSPLSPSVVLRPSIPTP
eukprot:bmy_22160T0